MKNKYLKKIKSSYLLLFSLMIVGRVDAQQDAMFSQYMFNYMSVNPAYAGSRDVLSLTSVGRYQWLNIKNSPRTIVLTGDMPILNERIGVGLSILHDQYNVTGMTTIMTNYAYRMRLGEKLMLALGLNAGLTQYAVNFNDLYLSEGVAAPNDIPFSTNIRTWRPNFGTGIYLNTDKWYISVSAPHLIKYNLLSKNIASTLGTGAVDVRQHYFFGAGMVLPLNEQLKLKPSFLGKFVNGAPAQIDGNINLWLKDRIGLGLSYRTGDAIIGLLEFQASPQFRLGFAYDQALTRLKRYNAGSYELMLRYEFGYGSKNKILSPRHF